MKIVERKQRNIEQQIQLIGWEIRQVFFTVSGAADTTAKGEEEE